MILACVLLLCSSFLSVSSDEKIDIDLSKTINENPTVVKLSEIAADILYIPLETKDEFVCGDSYDIRYVNNEIIVGTNRKFYHLDMAGNYLNTIGTRGEGPEEYNVGLLYFLDPYKKYLYVQDFHELTCYTFDGKFVKKVKTPNLNMGEAERFGENYIIYSNDTYFANKNEPNQLFIIDELGKVTKKIKGYIEEGKRYGTILSSRDIVYTFNGFVNFKPALENVIYRIDDSMKKKIVYKFKCGLKDIDISKNEIDVRNRNRSISIYQVHETQKYLFLLYGLEKRICCGMYDKQKKTFKNVRIVDDLSGGIDFVPAGRCYGGFLQMAYFPSVFKERKSYGSSSLSHRRKEFEHILSLDDEDNPVLVVVRLK